MDLRGVLDGGTAREEGAGILGRWVDRKWQTEKGEGREAGKETQRGVKGVLKG